MPRKKIKNPVTLFYPNLLLVNDVMKDVIKDHPFVVKQRDYFLFFHILCDAFVSYEAKDTFIQIHSDIVQDVLGRDYTAIIKGLVKHQYILVNEYASEYLGICKSYAIHPRLMDRTQPLKQVHIEYDTVLHNKINRIGSYNFSKNGGEAGFGEGRDHVIAMHNEIMLVPDEAALAYVKAEYERTNNPNSPETFFHYFNYNPMKGCGVDQFGKRVHSLVTNMPKVIRRCIRFKSAPTVRVVEKDIVNSQPFFLSVINEQLINQYVPECKEAVAVYAKYEANKDYKRFCEVASNGTFYEEFVSLYEKTYGYSYGSTPDDARNITKGLVYGVFFSDYALKIQNLNKPSTSSEKQLKKDFFKVFQNEFASVYELFTELKSLNWTFAVNKRGEQKQYANNCFLAQRIESGIMYDNVIPDLLAYGITDVITVHDCILVKETDAVAATAIMKQTFEQLNLNPQIQ